MRAFVWVLVLFRLLRRRVRRLWRPVKGQMVYVKDVNRVEVYSNGAWRPG